MGRKSNKEIEKIKLIKTEKEKFSSIIEVLDSNKQKIAANLIDNIAFVSVTLKDLRDHINAKGIKEEYKNGENQFGFKESVEVKNYNALLKNYLSCIKQLNDMLPPEIVVTEDDEFNEFQKQT